MARHKTVVIGFELGDGRLFHHWAHTGLLPTFKSLIEAGCWGWLATTAEHLHVSAWPSIYTGTSPGEHGVYFTFQPKPGLQGYQRFQPGLYGRPTFWQLLSQAGLQCTVLDAPYSHPEDGFHGTQVFDWGTWAHYLSPISTPASLLKRLVKNCGPYPLGLEAHDLGLDPLSREDARMRALGAIKAKTTAIRWLMGETEWDLFFTVFGETHFAGHYCWSPEASGVDGVEQQPVLRSIYQALDEAVAQIREAAGPETAIILISGDAIGPNYAGWHLLPEVLTRLGYSASAHAEATDSSPTGRFDPVKAIRDLLPKDLRKNLARKLPTALRDKLAQRVDTAGVDWSHTRAYCLPTDLEGCIRVNLEGREPMGIVKPGAEYESLCDELATSLSELVDPETNQKVVREVVRTDVTFPGIRRGYLPDLIVQWKSARPIVRVTTKGIGTVTGPSPDPRPGTHAAPGFVLARGAGIPYSQILEGRHIFDLAPTILARYGVAPPDHMRGNVWEEFSASVELMS